MLDTIVGQSVVLLSLRLRVLSVRFMLDTIVGQSMVLLGLRLRVIRHLLVLNLLALVARGSVLCFH